MSDVTSSNKLIKKYDIDKAFADSLSVGLFYTDINGNCLYANKKWLEIAGITLDEALADGWSNALHIDDRERIYKEWIEAVKCDKPFSSEYRFQDCDKNITWVIGQANKYNDQEGNTLGYVGTITDITERKNIESSLHQMATGFSVVNSNEFFRSFSIHLGELLNTDYVVVGEITDESPDIVKSVVVNHRGIIIEPLEYPLKGTPCATVIGKIVKGYADGVQKLFPEFELLKLLNIEGYVGTPLTDTLNKPIGIVAVLSLKPIENIKSVENILQIYAMRASAELERKQKEEELQSLNKELEFNEFSIQNISESIFWTDMEKNIQNVNKAACLSLGYTREELLQLSIFDIDPVVTQEKIENERKIRKELKNKEDKNIFETFHKTKDGRVFPVEITASYVEYDGKNYTCSIVRDISERKANEHERELHSSLQTAIFEATADGIVVTNLDKLFTNYNQNFIKLWGFKDINLLDESYESRIDLMTEKLKDPDTFRVRIKEIYEAIEEDTFDIIELKDGTIMERVSRPQRLEGKVVGRVWTFRDITENHKLSEQLSYQANHDALTGLVNRREFEKRLGRLITSLDGKSVHAMCYMDLDNFKQINDVCGHLAGDHLLKRISDLFQQNTRGRDTLARLGGDEFGLIMEHCSVEQAEKVATNFVQLISESDFSWEEQTFEVGVSVGVVKISDPDVSMLELIKNADVACYAAKKSGRNCVHISSD
jgi:diguanylate cyclase (GGDEF)-like protein/PAS domain S-box-containing protein